MPKTSYIITLAVDEKWFEAIDNFTADVYEGELCSWIRVEAETEAEDQDCENCEENPKENPEGRLCTSCRDEFKESDSEQ